MFLGDIGCGAAFCYAPFSSLLGEPTRFCAALFELALFLKKT
jgi:hypothetical protein